MILLSLAHTVHAVWVCRSGEKGGLKLVIFIPGRAASAKIPHLRPLSAVASVVNGR